jgi:hypothetical protein
MMTTFELLSMPTLRRKMHSQLVPNTKRIQRAQERNVLTSRAAKNFSTFYNNLLARRQKILVTHSALRVHT